MRWDPAIWLTKSLIAPDCEPVRISLTRLSWMFLAGRGAGRVGSWTTAIFALLMIETLTWLSRKKRWMYLSMWNSPSSSVDGPGFGGESGSSSAGFQGVQALPSSSTPAGFPPRPLKGLTENPAAEEALPGPWASARRLWGLFVLVLTMCVWSSKTNKSCGGPVSAYAADSNMSTGLTLKNRLPNTSFMARKAAAIPPVPARNCRRLIPSFLAAESAISLIRCSTCFCWSVCGWGMYSPLETIRVGTGDWKSSVSAGAHRAS